MNSKLLCLLLLILHHSWSNPPSCGVILFLWILFFRQMLQDQWKIVSLMVSNHIYWFQVPAGQVRDEHIRDDEVPAEQVKTEQATAEKLNKCILNRSTLIKTKTKFSSYIRKFRWDRLQSHMWKSFLMYEEMRKYLTIYEEAVSYVWLCNRSLLNFHIWEKFYILFYQCKLCRIYLHIVMLSLC